MLAAMMALFEFNSIEAWGPDLTVALSGVVPEDARAQLRTLRPEFTEDARELMEGPLGVDRMTLSSAIEAWLSIRPIAGYHGSRLTTEEAARVRTEGFRPLVAADRAGRLASILAVHRDWPEKAAGLALALEEHGPGWRAGRREGQVHFTLSRSALVEAFPHYLTHGSEFDQKVAHHMLGPEGYDLLGAFGNPVLFTVAVPGAEAIAVANRYGRRVGEVPEIVRQVADAWCWWLAYPKWPGSRFQPDCGLVFKKPVPPEWIVSAEVINFATEKERERQDRAQVR